ncbi:MAG: hypothetical protein WDM78_07325 [Puia sp.]
MGADDKAGCGHYYGAGCLVDANPEIKHGKIRVLFTPDEEIGRGVNKLDMKKLGC